MLARPTESKRQSWAPEREGVRNVFQGGNFGEYTTLSLRGPGFHRTTTSSSPLEIQRPRELKESMPRSKY